MVEFWVEMFRHVQTMPFFLNCCPGYCHRGIVESWAVTAGVGRRNHERDLSVMVEEDPVYCQWVLRESKDREHPSSRNLVAEWIHFTLFGIILLTIKLKVYNLWGL